MQLRATLRREVYGADEDAGDARAGIIHTLRQMDGVAAPKDSRSAEPSKAEKAKLAAEEAARTREDQLKEVANVNSKIYMQAYVQHQPVPISRVLAQPGL